MPSTVFWSVTNQGKVYTLSTGGQQWDELTYCGMEFKRVAAVDWCAWGIGGDHQMYVYVFATDVPIRYKEVSYQNQRWNPKEGFCSRLLPTDRPAWSSEDGLVARPRERIKLPTLSWQWEGDWRVEQNFDGQAADPEGWMYAIDFPATYTNEKGWMSYVRRRKWTRLRHYVSTNHWANVPSIHDDPVLEPFIDVSVGGQDIPGGNGDTLAVWTVTVLGRTMFRTDSNSTCPEGGKWVHIHTPQGREVNQLSVGPTGLLWAVMWNGSALIRLGVTRTKITGSHWTEVSPPNDSSKLLQVSVGTNSVWAITRDSKVWFRKGVRGSEAGELEDCATGSGWVEMVGEMSLLSVGMNDQVWALSADESKLLFFRTSITPQELCGKTWKAILLPRQSRTDCYSNCDESVTREIDSNTARSSQMSHLIHDSFASSASEDGVQVLMCGEPSGDSLKPSEIFSSSPLKDPEHISNTPTLVETKCKTSVSFEENQPNYDDSKRSRPSTPSASSKPGSETPKLTQKSRTASLVSLNGPAWMSCDDASYYDDTYTDFSWAWISGSGCLVDGQNPPNWFGSGLHGQQTVISEPWRKKIFKLLISRHSREIEAFSSYEQAIDKASWITTGIAQVVNESKHNQWMDCKLELEKTGAEHGFESATLCCFSHGGALTDWQKVVLNMSSVTCVVQASDRLKPILTIYTASHAIEQRPLRISFSSDTELEDWISLLNTTCCELQGMRGAPSLKAAWSLTNRGDIFTHDPPSNGELAHPSEMFWRQMGGHLRVVESCATGVVWGIGYNHKVWVYSGGWGGGVFKGMDSSGPNIHAMSDMRCIYIYENQRWNPLTGFSSRGLPTDRYMWSDKTGRYECTKENSKLPSMHWQWMTDWMIDFNTPGGVDREGWQYAKDFPMSYHNYKGLTDYVRRRRWFRKCKLTTSGPWEELDSVQLLDVSLQVNNSGCSLNAIQLWAVSIKGEVLCRMGVTKSCPKGLCWEHIPLEHPVTSVSIGGAGDVWVITKYGGAYLRHGINEHTPTGSVWFSVAPPERGGPLRHVSAGPSSIWAVDDQGSLWFRQEIMPIFPEGTSWKHICGNMRCISVGPQDEVWGIVDSLGNCTGVVCHRVGISKENKIGNGWEYGVGGGWKYISVRGFTLESDKR